MEIRKRKELPKIFFNFCEVKRWNEMTKRRPPRLHTDPTRMAWTVTPDANSRGADFTLASTSGVSGGHRGGGASVEGNSIPTGECAG